MITISDIPLVVLSRKEHLNYSFSQGSSEDDKSHVL